MYAPEKHVKKHLLLERKFCNVRLDWFIFTLFCRNELNGAYIYLTFFCCVSGV